MRLLNTWTIQLYEFFGSNIPEYAILSHRWEDGEISFKDVTKSRNLDAPGWAKVRASCALAESRSREWIWIDTCCIDRRSSAELSEAINSMFAWYKNSKECYAYLVDVPGEEAFKTAIRGSEWFLRGWTLQELIAPKDVLFFNQAWTMIGTRYSLGSEISSITGIEADTWDPWNPPVRNLSSLSIARRMSWASRRVCTREEDMAYCLLGIFEINMPLLYGEGGSRAFRRLQLEILKTSDDESIFAWYSFGHLSPYEQSIFGRFQSGDPSAEDELHLSDIVHRAKLPPITHELLAPSPAYFFKSHSIKCLKYFGRLPYTVTNKGLQFSADKRLLATAISTVLDSSGHEITAHVVPLNCFDSAKKTKFCLYISLTVPEKWFDFESSRSSFSRLHPTNLRNPPDEVVLSRKSKTQPRFENTTLLGISVMQTLYLTI